MIDLETLIDVPKAEVFKAGERAAVLTRREHGVQFTYLRRYLESGGDPVATTLPLTDEPAITTSGAVPPFFAGLLPEGRRLSAIRRAVKTSADDEFSLLLAIGAETIGDVQIIPANSPLPEFDPSVPASWSEVSFADLYERSIGSNPERVGIAGVQEKLSGRMIAFPTAEGRSILKLNPPEFAHIVENEAFFLDAAKAAGLDTATAQVVRDGAGRSGLLVTRFDRSVVNGHVQSIAQEDGCQVLGRYPADKYQPGLSEVITGLASVTGAPTVAAFELLRQFLFAYLSGNGDQHSKNFSVYKPDNEWRVTPAYDVPSTYFYGDHTLALRIDESGRNKDISRSVFIELAGSVGVSDRAAARLVDDQCAATEVWLQRTQALPFDEGSLKKYSRFVANRRRLLTQ